MQLLEGAFLDEPNPTQEELADLLEKIGKEGRLKGATISVAKLHRWFAHKRDRVEQEEQQRQLLLQQQEQQEDFSSSSSPAKTPTPQRGLDKSPFSKSSLSRAQGQNRNWSLEDDILSFSLFQKRGLVIFFFVFLFSCFLVVLLSCLAVFTHVFFFFFFFF